METVASEGASAMTSTDVLAAFYDRAAGEVYRYLARALFGDRSVAEDLTQETFAVVVAAARAGRAESLTMPWVMGVARHKLVDHYRRVSRDERRLALVWSRTPMAEEFEVLATTDSGQLVEAMRSLGSAQQLVLILRFVDELSVAEVAALLQRSVTATNSLIARARRSLLSNLAEVQP